MTTKERTDLPLLRLAEEVSSIRETLDRHQWQVNIALDRVESFLRDHQAMEGGDEIE